jgi:hypothetical protein
MITIVKENTKIETPKKLLWYDKFSSISMLLHVYLIVIAKMKPMPRLLKLN